MDKKEIKQIVSLKNSDTIEIAMKNRGWRVAKYDRDAGEVGFVELFRADEILSSPNVKEEDLCYQMSLYDNVEGGERWQWAILTVDRKYMKGWRPEEIRIFIKDKSL